METIAVYWEPRIKTYGIETVTDLVLIMMPLPVDRLNAWGCRLQRLGTLMSRFHLVLLQPGSEGAMTGYLVCEPAEFLDVSDLMIGDGAGDAGRATSVSVELVFFQGPHFNERYGIAAAAFEALESADIGILAAGFCGSTVYLVVPEGMAHRTKEILAGRFDMP